MLFRSDDCLYWWQQEKQGKKSYQEATQNKPWLWQNRYAALQQLMDKMDDMDEGETDQILDTEHTNKTSAAPDARKKVEKTYKPNKPHYTSRKTYSHAAKPQQAYNQKLVSRLNTRADRIATYNVTHWKTRIKGDNWMTKTKELTSNDEGRKHIHTGHHWNRLEI